MFDLKFWDWLALLWFLTSAAGYQYYAHRHARRANRLANLVHHYVEDWAQALQRRELRVVDTSVVANHERLAMMLAAGSLLIIAALLAVVAATDDAVTFASRLPFVAAATRQVWEFKVLLLLLLFVYAFFTFTWSLRQYTIVSVLIAAAPAPDAPMEQLLRERFGTTLSNQVWLAIHSFTQGLRVYYFSFALLAWFIHPYAFIVATTWILCVLYVRDFHSGTLKALVAGREHAPH